MRAYEVLTDGTEGIDLTVRTDGVTGVADVPSAAVLASVTDSPILIWLEHRDNSDSGS